MLWRFEFDAYIIETSKTGAVDILYPMVRYQEAFFPSHKYAASLAPHFFTEGIPGNQEITLDFFTFERGELRPVMEIVLMSCTPAARQETVLRANYLRVEVSC